MEGYPQLEEVAKEFGQTAKNQLKILKDLAEIKKSELTQINIEIKALEKYLSSIGLYKKLRKSKTPA